MSAVQEDEQYRTTDLTFNFPCWVIVSFSALLQVLGHGCGGAHHMVGCMSKSYGRVAENHELSYGRPLYHVMSGCYRFLEVSTI